MGSQRQSYQQRRRTGWSSGSSGRANQRSDEGGKKKFTFGSSRNGGQEAGAGRQSSSTPITTEGAPPLVSEVAGSAAALKAEHESKPTMFTPQQQKVIIEHLLITKSTAPQKNYSHVPCKFFRQGSCQAGNSCPFSHSLDSNTADQTPCEYFKRGNCKFGSKCANAHILPDGVRVNPTRQYKSRPHHSQGGSDNNIQPPVMHLAVATQNCIYEEDEQGFGGAVGDAVQKRDEDACEEFYIPTDFADLLTPEELKRRNSRSSSSSVSSSLKKPDFSHSHSQSLSSSSSSFGSEPLFSTPGSNYAYHQRTYSGASLSSSASSSTTSPLLHQQLSFLQQPQSVPPVPASQNFFYYNSNACSAPKTQQSTKVNYSPWAPLQANSAGSRANVSWLSNDLTKLKIDEEDSSTASLPSFNHESSNLRQDTQFFFDDIPVRFDQA